MTGRIELKAFIAYQIKSVYHSGKRFRDLGKELNIFLMKHSPRDHAPFFLDIEYGEFPPGANIWKEVRSKIEVSHVAIFDISENNPNVLLEAGIALGLDKHVIFLKSQQADKVPLPTDISSVVYVSYRDSKELSSPRLVKAIANSIMYYMNHCGDVYLYHRLLWGLDPASRTLIVPGILPEGSTFNKFEDYVHIRIYGDIDAIVEVKETLHRLYPRMEVSVVTAKAIRDLPQNWAQCNIIFVGGPDFNPLVKDFDEACPVEYRYGEPGEDKVWLYHTKRRRQYMPVFKLSDGKQRARDYGFFMRTSRTADKSVIIFFGGARTWGVLGAVKLLSCTSFDANAESHDNAQELVCRFGSNPSLFIPVEVDGTREGLRPPKWSLKKVEQIQPTV